MMLTLQITDFIESRTILQLKSIDIYLLYYKMHYKPNIYTYLQVRNEC